MPADADERGLELFTGFLTMAAANSHRIRKPQLVRELQKYYDEILRMHYPGLPPFNQKMIVDHIITTEHNTMNPSVSIMQRLGVFEKASKIAGIAMNANPEKGVDAEQFRIAKCASAEIRLLTKDYEKYAPSGANVQPQISPVAMSSISSVMGRERIAFDPSQAYGPPEVDIQDVI